MDPTNETSWTTDLIDDLMDVVVYWISVQNKTHAVMVRKEFKEVLDKYNI